MDGIQDGSVLLTRKSAPGSSQEPQLLLSRETQVTAGPLTLYSLEHRVSIILPCDLSEQGLPLVRFLSAVFRERFGEADLR